MALLESSTYFSNGKLLIAGEYFVLEGATAFAVPLKQGQKMQVDTHSTESHILNWSVHELSKPTFSGVFDTIKFDIIGPFKDERIIRLRQILRALKILKPDFLGGGRSIKITCTIEFNMNWGWGSSSSLICNLARWTHTDPFRLNSLVSPGSGYDIAASGSQTPVYFRLADEKYSIEPATFNPPFKENIFFVFTGRKQNTQDSIIRNMESIKKNRNIVREISWLAEKISVEKNLGEFMRLIAGHENIISKTLDMRRIKELCFGDFSGEVKSLGAWGGDFIMAASPERNEYVSNYFKAKGMNPIFRFDEIIRQNGMA